jgi:hypothetical protein
MNLNITVSIKESTPQPSTSFSPGIVPYMQTEDRIAYGFIRSCAPCPAVFVMKDDSHVSITKQWQYYMLAINPSMTLENVFYLMDNNLAFCNSTGFRNDGDPRADWFHDRNITDGSKPPQFDKVRICSRNATTGVEQYILVSALKATMNALQLRLRAGIGKIADVRAAILTKVLNVVTFDSRFPPPLKSGRSYPSTISQINPDDYLYLPQYNREKFIVANIVNSRGEIVQFPRGGLYSWTNDNTPYSFLPIISNPTYGQVLYTIDKNLIKLPVGSDVPRPYRQN